MLIDVVMPQLGESVVEGVVVKWLVAAGDAVAKDQALLTISTDKVDAEIPSPSAGRMAEVLVREGETVPVRTVLAQIETEGAKASAPEAPARPPWDEETEGLPGSLARKTEPPLPAPPRVEPAPPPPAPAAAPAPPPCRPPRRPPRPRRPRGRRRPRRPAGSGSPRSWRAWPSSTGWTCRGSPAPASTAG